MPKQDNEKEYVENYKHLMKHVDYNKKNLNLKKICTGG